MSVISVFAIISVVLLFIGFWVSLITDFDSYIGIIILFCGLILAGITYCFLYNKNTNYCRWQSSKLQREFPYYCRALFGIFLSPQFLWI